MTFEPAGSITERIADHLQWEVVGGRLNGGDRIHEQRLARELDVSRGSVREALLLLQGRGVVELVPRRGAAVRALKQEDIDTFREIFVFILTRALARIDRYDSRAGEALLEPICRAAREDRAEGVVQARDAFLRSLVNAGAGELLRATLTPLLTVACRVGMRASASADFDPRDSYRWCSSLHVALMDGDTDRVADLVCAFVRRECGLAENKKNN